MGIKSSHGDMPCAVDIDNTQPLLGPPSPAYGVFAYGNHTGQTLDWLWRNDNGTIKTTVLETPTQTSHHQRSELFNGLKKSPGQMLACYY